MRLLSAAACLTFVVLQGCIGIVFSERHRQASARERRLADEWLQKNPWRRRGDQDDGLLRRANSNNCPCEDSSLCHPITNFPPVRSKEVFGFTWSVGQDDLSYFNWTHVTTIAWASDSIMCQAHDRGVRVISGAPSINLTTLQDDEIRKEWVQNVTHLVKSRFMDGITFDYELPIEDSNSAEARVYVDLIRETKESFALHIHPNLQVTVCVAWSPDSIDGRNYPAKALADASHALYVMDYDTQSQIMYGPCMAAANAPLYGMIRGIERYLQMGIPANQLILGVPWYGYRYPCLTDDDGDDNTLRRQFNLDMDGGDYSMKSLSHQYYCPIAKVPFRGVPCSDAAGSEVPYHAIIQLIVDRQLTVHFDENQYAPYFTVLEEHQDEKNNRGNDDEDSDDDSVATIHQYWFDNADSLKRKYAWANSVGLLGVGPYAYHDVNFPQSGDSRWEPFASSLWSSFDAFFPNNNKDNVNENNNEYSYI
mmetsp:Transcript_14772/g.19330  ORF Transcript_14772/g.19330 Transcript_14772/m.19330 type:complete len:479 (+) Transcript_14772:70-1506(+)